MKCIDTSNEETCGGNYQRRTLRRFEARDQRGRMRRVAQGGGDQAGRARHQLVAGCEQ